jgi:hypothetical protein
VLLWPALFIFDRLGNGLMGGDSLINTAQNALLKNACFLPKLVHLGLTGRHGRVWLGGSCATDNTFVWCLEAGRAGADSLLYLG